MSFKIMPLVCCCDIKINDKLSQVNTLDQKIFALLSTILERCKKEKEQNCLQLPLDDYYERVSYYTAYPKMFIYTMIEGKQFIEPVFDIYDHILLLECINNIYSERSLIKFKYLYKHYVQFKNLTDPNQVTKMSREDENAFDLKLSTWGYSHKKITDGSSILLENQKYKFDRFNYLHKIQKYRQDGRQIYYVDEKYILRDRIRKYSNAIEQNKFNPGFLYFYIITENGYENGLLVLQDNEKTFEETFHKWMIEIVLPSIQPSSVIVMENNVLHGLFPKKHITRYNSKKEMIYWLKENNIPCDINMAKPELYDLIEKCTQNNKENYIDRIFKANGHDVLRLPVTFKLLTPTAFMWEYLKNMIDFTGELSAKNFKEIILPRIKTLNSLLWKEFSEKVIQLENDIYKIDTIAENLLEDYELDNTSIFE